MPCKPDNPGPLAKKDDVSAVRDRDVTLQKKRVTVIVRSYRSALLLRFGRYRYRRTLAFKKSVIVVVTVNTRARTK